MARELLLATRKGLFQVGKQSNGAWKVNRVSFLGDNVAQVLADPRDQSLYACMNLGHFGSKLKRSTDGGETWTELAVPTFPEKPADEIDNDPFRGTPREWKLKVMWCLESGGDDRPGRLWCGTTPGGLFRSDDSGASWTLVDSLWNDPRRKQWFGGGFDDPGIHSICVDPKNNDHVTIGISCGGIWHTHDAGKSWELSAKGMVADFMPPEQAEEPNIQDAHRLVACPANHNIMYVQHHNGIFRSEDAGYSWSRFRPTNVKEFGFAVAVHPTDANKAWFVPAIKDETRVPDQGKVIVSRTNDGCANFDVLSNGLPQEHAYDIVFRHALDIDSTGDVLAIGSSTGSLWISENQGDSWIAVNTHLPPIYALRFVPWN